MRSTHIPRRAYRISGKDETLGGRTNKLLPIRHRACEGLLGRGEMKSTQIDRKARLAHAAICTFSDLHVRTTGHDFNECRICQRGRCYPRNWRSTAGDERNAFHNTHAVVIRAIESSMPDGSHEQRGTKAPLIGKNLFWDPTKSSIIEF
ncbi:hypothetical protein I7I51_03186 [Histoplasma capsulatum]|uniref:Uncharacterized protein n=1 Tax=Ajellomyces capsulatus TaxID=5037 RepID=A0A8A1MQB6_AJECA|nr:hypothetical protein I7I51_03186 [Histoplasma capsulatum]